MESLVKKYRAAFDLFKEQKRLGKNTEQSRMAVGQIARQILELDLKNPAVDERLVVGHLGKPAIEVNSVDGNQKPVRKIYYLSDDVDKFHVIVIAPDNEGKVVSHYESYVRDAESE